MLSPEGPVRHPDRGAPGGRGAVEDGGEGMNRPRITKRFVAWCLLAALCFFSGCCFYVGAR